MRAGGGHMSRVSAGDAATNLGAADRPTRCPTTPWSWVPSLVPACVGLSSGEAGTSRHVAVECQSVIRVAHTSTSVRPLLFAVPLAVLRLLMQSVVAAVDDHRPNRFDSIHHELAPRRHCSTDNSADTIKGHPPCFAPTTVR